MRGRIGLRLQDFPWHGPSLSWHVSGINLSYRWHKGHPYPGRWLDTAKEFAGRRKRGKGGLLMKPLLIYVAGPYTGSSRHEVDRNVNRAIDAGIEIFYRGHFPYVPHLTDLVDRRAREVGRELSWSDFMAWDAPWLRAIRCPAICRGIQRRKHGCWSPARRLGKDIFFSVSEVPRVKQCGTPDVPQDQGALEPTVVRLRVGKEDI